MHLERQLPQTRANQQDNFIFLRHPHCANMWGKVQSNVFSSAFAPVYQITQNVLVHAKKLVSF